MKRAIILLSVILAAGCCVKSAQGAIITIAIEGVVDHVADPDNYLDGLVNVGDLITGTYTYNTDTADSTPEYPTVGRYDHFGPPAGIYLTIGGFEFETDTLNVDFLVAIANNVTSDGLHDSYWIHSYNNLPLADGTFIGGIFWTLRDYSATAVSSIDLPATAPTLDDWGINRLSFGGGTRARGFVIEGHVTSTVVIPEPGTLLLFSFGGLIFVRRAKR